MANNNPAHIVLTNVRLSYAHLDKPYSNNGGEPKYSATILVPKTDPANRQKIDAAIRAATARMREKKGNSFPQRRKLQYTTATGASIRWPAVRRRMQRMLGIYGIKQDSAGLPRPV